MAVSNIITSTYTEHTSSIVTSKMILCARRLTADASRLVTAILAIALTIAAPFAGHTQTRVGASKLSVDTCGTTFRFDTAVLIGSIVAVRLAVAMCFQRDALASAGTAQLVRSAMDRRTTSSILVRIIVAVVIAVAQPVYGYAAAIGARELRRATRLVVAQRQLLVGSITAVIVRVAQPLIGYAPMIVALKLFGSA